MKFKENLKKFRLEQNLSRQKLAEKVGVSVGLIYFYETGARNPGIKVASKLAKELNVTLNQLIGE